MENVIITLKEEETRLKDKVGSLHREMSRLEGELMDCQERLAESEKLNIRQQRELDAVADLHRKVSFVITWLRSIGNCVYFFLLKNKNVFRILI